MSENKFEPKKQGLNFAVDLLCDADGSEDKSGVDIEIVEDFINQTGLKERSELDIPGHSEPEIVRHFTRLSQKNYSIDTGFYPLGSCTMKYNPRLNEKLARLPGFADMHPNQPEESVQGALELMHELQNWLAKISGLAAVSLNPSAGAHGEYTGIKVIKQAHLKKSGNARKYVLIPESAHGTNPATAVAVGYEVINIDADTDGRTLMSDLEEKIAKYGNEIAAIMLTNPNTSGKFETHSLKISQMIHDVGAYFYCDGANFNAIMGNLKPADFGVDVMHFNLHKTFSTPHGGGGPGCGPIAVSDELKEFLPTPYAKKNSDGSFSLVHETENSIGQIKGFYGQFTLMVRALSYMLSMGRNGIKQGAKDAVLSANYILARLKDYYHVPFPGKCMHECLLTDKFQKSQNVSTLDIAKSLIEYGIHPMTVYFPLIVNGAMLIEPTETESKATIDYFIDTMIYVAKEVANGNGEKIRSYPESTEYCRFDETKAAREPILTWFMLPKDE